MSAYVYRGTIRDAEPEPTRKTPGPKPRPGVFDPDKCGTIAGYRQHQHRGDPTCRDCKDAMADYSREYWHRRKTEPTLIRGFDPSACGTYAGYKRHQRYEVPPCDACRAAGAEYRRKHRKVTQR